jgi:hypothetical protein
MRILHLFASLLLATGIMVAVPTASNAGFDFSFSFDLFSPHPVAVAPPPMPVYVIPEPPMDGYVWSPGYWRMGEFDYFWVPGTWVQPPVVGVLWTPGYWGWTDGSFVWHEGYWGPHVGFYGGVNYGGGYGGVGFVGGGWQEGVYNVNRSVINVANVTNVTNGYTSTASFNGGPGGTSATPTDRELAVAHEKHIAPTKEQVTHAQAASKNPALAVSANHGKPAIAATTAAGDFKHGIVAAKQAGARNPAAEQRNAAVKKNPSLAKGAVLPKSVQQSGDVITKPYKPTQPYATGLPHKPVAPADKQLFHKEDAGKLLNKPVEQPQVKQLKPQLQVKQPQLQVKQSQPQVKQSKPQVKQPQPKIKEPKAE